MATQAGNPRAGAEGGEEGTGQWVCWGAEKQPRSGQFLPSADWEACERLLGGRAGRAARSRTRFYSRDAI